MIMTIAYNLDAKWLPINKLRSNGIVKIMVVAVVWTGLVILAPHYSQLHLTELSLQILLKSAFVFTYVMMLTTSFDQRDLLIDSQQLNTLPQLFKRKLIYFYIAFGIILNFILFASSTEGWLLILSVFIVNLSTFLCFKSTEYKSFYYTAFWIEGLPILWYILSIVI